MLSHEKNLIKNFIEKLEELLDNIENGGIKNNIKILNTNIYDYIEESHKIINDLFNNLNQLTKYVNTTGILRERDILKTIELINTFVYKLQEKYLSKEQFIVVIETK